ncbi:MAG: response regulator [Nitriliruptorales bacterium]
MTTIVVVDDNAAVRETVASVLAVEPDFEVVARVPSAASAIATIERAPPDVVVIDQWLLDGDGTQLCADIRRRAPRTRVIVSLSYARASLALAAFAAGAAGAVVKGTDLGTLRHAIRAVAEGGTWVDPTVARPFVDLALDEAHEETPAEPARTGAGR